MGNGMTPEIERFLLLNDPNYQRGYEDGFNSCKNEILEDIKKLENKIKKLGALEDVTATDTFEVTYKLNS
jgi:hypothetical protein